MAGESTAHNTVSLSKVTSPVSEVPEEAGMDSKILQKQQLDPLAETALDSSVCLLADQGRVRPPPPAVSTRAQFQYGKVSRRL